MRKKIILLHHHGWHRHCSSLSGTNAITFDLIFVFHVCKEVKPCAFICSCTQRVPDIVYKRSGLGPAGSGSGPGRVRVWTLSGPGLGPVGSGSGHYRVRVWARSGPGLDTIGSGSGPGRVRVWTLSGPGLGPVGSGSGHYRVRVGSGSENLDIAGPGSGSGPKKTWTRRSLPFRDTVRQI